MRLLLAGIAMVAVAGPGLIVATAPPVRPTAAVAARPQRVVPAAELPPVEPTAFVEIAREDARSFNATVPFSAATNPPARPFRFGGGPEDLARATDCLAAGVVYEAGDDVVGERAVAQVVLNRLRHPAFPKTVCGVVFQGQERSTGCQFTFTCDGALRRPPSEGGWRRARGIAAAALAGSVYAPVGHATHYHTDWVVPYWSSSLDKIAKVGTHLFFRWTGWWGTPSAFDRRPQSSEPVVSRIAYLSPVHGDASGTAITLMPEDMADAEALKAIAAAGAFAATAPLPDPEFTPDRDSFLMTLPANIAPQLWPALADKTCGSRSYCKVLGWTDRSRTPTRLPLNTAQVAGMSFSYLRDRQAGIERKLWNCRETKRPVPVQCMKLQTYIPAGETLPAPATATARGPEALGGVRRRNVEPAVRPPSTAVKGGRSVTPPGTSPAATP
ncbi:cell wall hydrolase [uncultured Sphingomonas sp.]|uniref:cell wall hydrolase n=1 Tax=uncultured Sphingomonas sp. TaxID=158754 RepID=UPI0035CC1AD2